MFTHLHVHSEYSLLDGMPTAKELAQAAADLGQRAIAITDHGNLHGAIDFYKACKDKGIKPIIGCEVYTTIDRKDKDESSLKERGASDWHLVLLARNDVGYANLIKIVTDAHLEGFYRRPRTDDEILAAYSEGIVALSACMKGRIPDLLLRGDKEEAARVALEYKEMFDGFYLELQANSLPEQALVNAELIRLGGMLDIPLVVTCDSHYIFANDASVHEVLLAIGTNKKMDDDDRLSFGAEDFYLKSPEEILAMVPIQEALDNTVKIADMIELEIDNDDLYLPHVEVPFGYDEDQYLARLCGNALYELLAEQPDSDAQVYWDRLEHELTVIEQKGIAGYFLVVWDLVAWSVKNDIAMGPGRGSVGGSLVSYLLGITKIDPIEHDLLFERFINPERVLLPDIDLDFCYDNRHRIMEYVTNKYGSDKVANVATFGTLTSRSVLDGVASAMGIPFADRKIITKSVPAEPGITLDEALEKSQRLREHEQAHPEVFRIAKRLEGRKRHRSTHACGLILANVPLTDFTALRRAKGSQGEIVTHLDMDTLGEIGAVKFDVLGLKTVTVIDRTAKAVGIDIDKIPLDCEETYKLFRTGQLSGVFQLEGSWASQNVKEIGPTEFRHLVDAVSLIRPGPMESGATDDYMTYRHGRKEISYLHPDLEDLLCDTYGVLVYQEQVMNIAGVFAGYTPAQQDSFRAAIGKKKKEDLDEELAIFRQRAIEREYGEYIVDNLCQAISKHARYSFNKSHATGYAMLAYQTAYLKVHHPLEFMAAILTSDQASGDKVTQYIAECKRLGLRVLPPDINKSSGEFTVDDGSIIFSLSAIKNVGDNASREIVSGQPYESMEDFVRKVARRTVNKKVMEALIQAGAFDCFNPNRREVLRDYYTMRAEEGTVKNKDGTVIDPNAVDTNYSDTDRMNDEIESLGVYISAHPCDNERNDDWADAYDGETLTVTGIVASLREVLTKREEDMGIVTMDLPNGRIEVVVFPRQYKKFSRRLKPGQSVVITGARNDRGIIAENIDKIEKRSEGANGQSERGIHPERTVPSQ